MAELTATATKTRARVHVALVLVQIAFASLAVEAKLAMAPPNNVPVAALAMARIVGAALVFGLIQRAFGVSSVASWRDRAGLALLSVFGVVLNQALFLAGLHRTSAMSATLLVATIPVMTALVAAVSGRERLTAKAAAGISVALFGVAYLTGFAIPPLGDLFVLANALSYAVYLVFSKPLLERYGPVTFMAWVFGSAAVLFAPLGALSLARELPRLAASPRAAALVLFVVFVPTIFAYSVNAWALVRATPTLVTVYVYLQPLVVAALAWLQLGQAVNARVVVGGLLILAGVGLVSASSRRARQQPHKKPADRA